MSQLFTHYIFGAACIFAAVSAQGAVSSVESGYPLRANHEDTTTFVTRAGSYPINTGSLLGFDDPGAIGNLIRCCSADIPGGLSHVGVAVVGYPSEIMQIICESATSGGLKTRRSRYIKAQMNVMRHAYPYLRDINQTNFSSCADIISTFNETLNVFCLESTGTPAQVKRGLMPRVQITPLQDVITEYKGDVCVRALYTPIKLESFHPVIVSELGVSYEKKLGQLLKSRKDKNQSADSSSWFCSELVAYLYQTQGLLPDTFAANNVIPKEFSSYNAVDYLSGHAYANSWLKYYER